MIPIDSWYEIFMFSDIREKLSITILSRDIRDGIPYAKTIAAEKKRIGLERIHALLPPNVYDPVDLDRIVALCDQFEIVHDDVYHPTTKVTLLMYACRANRGDLIPRIRTIDVNTRDIRQRTAFAYWCIAGHEWSPNLNIRFQTMENVLQWFEERNVNVHTLDDQSTPPSYWVNPDTELYTFLTSKGVVYCENM